MTKMAKSFDIARQRSVVSCAPALLHVHGLDVDTRGCRHSDTYGEAVRQLVSSDGSSSGLEEQAEAADDACCWYDESCST